MLSVARAHRDVLRAEQALSVCLAHEHESIAKLYQYKANSGEGKVHDMDMGIGSIRATIKRCGMAVDFTEHDGAIFQIEPVKSPSLQEQDYSTLLPRLQTTVEADRRSTQDVSYCTPYSRVYVEPSMSAPPSYIASVEGSQLVPNEHVSEVREWFGPTQEENELLNLVYPPTPVVEAAEAGPAHIGQAQEPGSPIPSSLALSDYKSLPEAPVAPHAPSVRSESYDPNDYDPPSALLRIQQELAPLFMPERVVDWLVKGLSPKTSTEEGVARSH
ncbi:hypothetical protein L210DRAFT_3652030 [Boletus edulis BED1]|uniref:Uncharacterized protein n=1 Tax=Boletus edulis BED1 TaxID=1328754 RepID=A0AAD4BHL0_BOLED|nr:hypothetical protein L210DRAFT_3652030 [Boletus edulis BED1]